MGTSIGEVNINLRMSLVELKKDVRDGTTEVSKATKKMADDARATSKEATGSLALIGEEIGVSVPRHIRTFITSLPAIGTALAGAFSAVAVVALADVVIKTIEKIKELSQEIGGFGKEAQEAYAKLVEGNKAALKAAEELRDKYRELALIGLSGGGRDAVQTAIDIEREADARAKLTAGLARQKEIQEELAYSGTNLTLSALGPTGAALNVVSNKLGITEDNSKSLRKELSELVLSNQALAQSLKTDEFQTMQHDMQADAAAADRLSEAQKKLAELLFRVRQEATKVHPALLDLKLPNQLQEPFDLAKSGPTFQSTFGGAIDKQSLDKLTAAREVYEATRTAAEKYAHDVDDLNMLLGQGYLSQETFNRAVTEAKQKYDETYRGLEEMGKAIGDNLAQAALYGGSWTQAFKQISISIAEVILKMTLLNALQNSSFGGTSLGGLFKGILGGVTGKAAGGPVYQGSGYMVGEHGPEWFTPSTSGAIIPNGAMSGGGKGGDTINVQVDVHGVTDKDSFIRNKGSIASAIAAQLALARRNGG